MSQMLHDDQVAIFKNFPERCAECKQGLLAAPQMLYNSERVRCHRMQHLILKYDMCSVTPPPAPNSLQVPLLHSAKCRDPPPAAVPLRDCVPGVPSSTLGAGMDVILTSCLSDPVAWLG